MINLTVTQEQFQLLQFQLAYLCFDYNKRLEVEDLRIELDNQATAQKK